jgi:hypothetical protein
VLQNKIFLIREKKVMLDKDLAELYGVKPIRLREQVKRNIRRFPPDFMFQLSEKEADAMVSHFCDTIKKALGRASTLRLYRTWNSYAFQRP